MTSLFLASLCRPQLLKITDYYNYVALDLNLCSLGILATDIFLLVITYWVVRGSFKMP